jgi:hypothetical protein
MLRLVQQTGSLPFAPRHHIVVDVKASDNKANGMRAPTWDGKTFATFVKKTLFRETAMILVGVNASGHEASRLS